MLFKKNYPELDLLRAIAITLVMLVHFKQNTFNLPLDSYLSRFLDGGYHGVDLFFVLSGFLIGGQLIEGMREGTFSFKVFYIKRTFRIAPAYYFALLVSVLYYSVRADMFILRDERVLNYFITHIFYLQDYIPAGLHRRLYWSLAVEEQFYIIIPALLYIVHGRRSGRLAGALLTLILGAFALKFLIYDPSKDWSTYFYQPLHMRADSLLLGVLAALVFINYREKIRERAALFKVILYSVAGVCLWLTYAYGSFGHGQGNFNSTWQFILSGIGFAALILACATFSRPNLPLQSVFRPIARYSYAMYLYHTMIKVVFLNFFVKYFSVSNTRFVSYFIVFFFYFIFVFLLCGLHYIVIEKPFLNYRKKLVAKM